MGARLRRSFVGLVAVIAAAVLGGGLLGAPAQAAAPAPNLIGAGAVTVDCSSLQGGSYTSIRVTATVAGATPGGAYVFGIDQGGPVPTTPGRVIGSGWTYRMTVVS
ncbi:hypothetical protein ABCS02_16715 [Microbacterium sp. X-17]|uniref:hypothetical protein n=1 Tax=Microbacterium sp. X-17 TaxID=3144404 RepID=UPI0031F51358